MVKKSGLLYTGAKGYCTPRHSLFLTPADSLALLWGDRPAPTPFMIHMPAEA